MTRLLVTSFLHLPLIMQAKVFIVQTVAGKPDMEHIYRNTRGQDYGPFDFNLFGIKLETSNSPMIIPMIKIETSNSPTTAIPVKNKTVSSTIESKNATSDFQLPTFEGKQENNKCQQMPPDEKKNTCMN